MTSGANQIDAPGLHSRHALLAQSVEHLHGKEGVDGSSPSEGLKDLATGVVELYACGRYARYTTPFSYDSLAASESLAGPALSGKSRIPGPRVSG